jgi:sugar/nucleoside kinase (ribokinase family)
MPRHPKIVVVGSLNVDHTLCAPHIPSRWDGTAAFADARQANIRERECCEEQAKNAAAA